MSLNGVMQAPGGPGEDPDGGFEHGGWLVPHADEDMGNTMIEIFSKADAFLLGRTTYDIFAGHWPRVTDPEVQVHGSCGLAQTLIEHDLVDEYRLLTFPVVLGTGKRLFGSGAVPVNLKLVSSSTTGAGTVVSVYRRGGALQKGSFMLDDG